MSKGKEEIREGVREFYKQRIGRAPAAGRSCCTPGKAADAGIATLVGYSDEELESIPGDAAGASFGCGNPLAFSEVKEGQTVLDLGSGAGIDCFLAANRVGESGRVIGLDMTQEMIDRAEKAADQGGYGNVEFVLGEIEEMPVKSSSVDWIISNCVINLSPEKDRVFSEAYRVLKPGGRLLISDLVVENLPDRMREDMTVWAGCIAGATSEEDYLGMITGAGFEDVSVVDRVDHKSGTAADPMKVSSIRVSALKREGGRRMKQISNVLDVETQLLISIGSAVASGCVPCLENLVEKARAEGIDEKKLRAAARTGQFVKDQPASHMRALADELLGTHLLGASAPAGGCCPMEPDDEEAGGGSTAGACGCS